MTFETGSLDQRRALVEMLRAVDFAIEAARGAAPDAPEPVARERRLEDLHSHRERLMQELRALDFGGADPAERAHAALAWFNGVPTAEDLVVAFVAHPALGLPGAPAEGHVPLPTARRMLVFRNRQPSRVLNRLDQLLEVPGVDARLLGHLVHTGAVRTDPERWPAPDASTRYPIGVLLPLRIETRFYAGRLRIRVVPDEPFFARHDPRVAEGELSALSRYLAAVAAASSAPDQEQAWRELATHVGGPRAVYLLRYFVAIDSDGVLTVRDVSDDERRTEAAFARIKGFPKELHVWLARGGSAPRLAHTLVVDHSRLRADFADPDTPDERRWWEDWDEAVITGVAAEIALDGDISDIDVLYVTGLGDAEPTTLFENHRDAGQLGLVNPGVPTNTVDGAPAAPLAQDAAAWWEVLHTPPTDTDRLVSHLLCGDANALGHLPGDGEPHQTWGSAIVTALWPALWGWSGTDVWGIVPGTQLAAGWGTHALFAEGPFPAVRVGSQPYGLLPATASDRWRAAANDPPVEGPLLAALLPLRDRWRQAAEHRGTVRGTSTAELLDLLAQTPTSSLYRQRRAWPLELWWLATLLVGRGVRWLDFERAWLERYALTAEIGLDPVRRYGAAAAPRRVPIPLVIPPALPAGTSVGDAILRLVAAALEAPSLFARPAILEEEILGFRADSVLLRLITRSLQVALADVGRELAHEPPPGLEPLLSWDTDPSRLEAWLDTLDADAFDVSSAPVVALRRVLSAFEVLAEVPEARLESLLRATLDTATHRIDPWLVGVPTRRLQDIVASGQAQRRLGAYGWVDAPAPGNPGPTPAGLLHAPSPAQALTAAVLRDRAVNDAEPSRWDLDLTSASVRAAERLAEHVRQGAHLAEALGREVERIVAAPATITRLRRDFPIRTEHAGRRVCDGLGILAADPSTLGLDTGQLAGLTNLRTAVEAYGDLLVAEGVHHITEGRAEAAGAAMDAAAGLSRAPHLGVLHAPRLGRNVTTSVVAVLGAVAEPPLPADPLERAEVSPTALVDAAVAAALREHVGDASVWTWTVTALDADLAPTGPSTSVALTALGLRPGDVLSLPLTDLERLVREAGATALGVADGAAAITSADGSARYERAGRLVTLLGRTPATPDALTEQVDAAVDTTAVDQDLRDRYARIHETASALGARLGDELALTDAVTVELGAADVAVLTRLVVAARAWGIAPDPPAGTTAESETAARERRLVAAARRVDELLESRLRAAPAPSSTTGMSRDDVVAAVAALVSPTGQVAVTSRLRRTDLPTLAAEGTSTRRLDEEWLPIIAAVRTPLARIEVHQLAAPTASNSGPAFTAWSNKPDDPWQKDGTDGRRMIVAYTAATLDLAALPASAMVAVAGVDRWAEVVPDEDQTTAAAFGFDAPAARAPQAIVLAVPPDLGAGLDAQTVLDIVTDVRLLARARMARPIDLPPEAHGLLPSALLPAAGTSAVFLDASGS